MTEERSPHFTKLGTTDISISPMGIGTWAWGDRVFWNYGRDHQEADIPPTVDVMVENGINFVDTAEVYGKGKSERLVGKYFANEISNAVIATKFFPFPWRLTKKSLIRAIQKSLERLQLAKVQLYQIHFPYPPVTIETWAGALQEAVQRGLIEAIGVSNYNSEQMQRMQSGLIKYGHMLASNQVSYSLLDRKIEKDGLLELCREQQISIIAYSPLAQGMLTGKYTPENPPHGFRARRYSARKLGEIQHLVRTMRNIGQEHKGKTPAQVALNWVMAKGAIPIPGAKNARQAQDNAGALGWQLSTDEVAALDTASDRALAVS